MVLSEPIDLLLALDVLLARDVKPVDELEKQNNCQKVEQGSDQPNRTGARDVPQGCLPRFQWLVNIIQSPKLELKINH